MLHLYRFTHSNLVPELHPTRGNSVVVRLDPRPESVVVCNSNIVWPHDPCGSKLVLIFLLHLGTTRTEATIRQHFDWKGLRPMVIATCHKCLLCQKKAKTTNQKYGKLPAKLAEENPWDTLCVDLLGPYKIRRTGKSDLHDYGLKLL
jgi:hypothetical protein